MEAKVRLMRDGIIEDSMEVAIEVALAHKAIVVRRLQAEGIPGKHYSENGIPASLMENNQYARLNSGFDKLIKDKKKSKEKVAWKDVRAAQGLQTSFVDYTFSRRTLKNLTIIDTRIDGGGAVAELGGSEEETKDRLSYGFDRYGDFLAPTEEEADQLGKAAQDELKKRMDKYKLI